MCFLERSKLSIMYDNVSDSCVSLLLRLRFHAHAHTEEYYCKLKVICIILRGAKKVLKIFYLIENSATIRYTVTAVKMVYMTL